MRTFKLKKPILLSLLFIVIVGVGIDVLILPILFRFLSDISRNDNAEILVVQGWIFDTMVDQTVAELKRGNYQAIVISGRPSSAKQTKNRLMNKGIDESLIFLAPYGKNTKKDFTFNEAIYVKKMLDIHFPELESINIATSEVHSKKSVTIFRKVLGERIRVGIVACKSNNFNADSVWKSKLGIYNTIRFFVGYLYALVWKVEWIKLLN